MLPVSLSKTSNLIFEFGTHKKKGFLIYFIHKEEVIYTSDIIHLTINLHVHLNS